MVLIVDDDKAVRTSLSLLLTQAGYEVTALENPEKTLHWVRSNTPELILMDMNYSLNTSGLEGLELLQKVKIFLPTTPVILITGWGTIELAVEGVKLGAVDFITKPWDNHSLLKSVKTNIELSKSEDSPIQSSRKELNRDFDFDNIIGEDDKIVEILNIVARIANTNASVLITGESGTGKELIAEAIHNNSNRKKQAFVKVNLGGISTSLFESEMFGHKKGAFTDAYTDRKGRFELANGGTIFLDEIGDLDLQSQVKLLRVLQEQTYEVLGDSMARRTDVRVICATNKNLPLMVQEGKFREDLYYRINLININLPSLRERVNDIPLLAKHFLVETLLKNNLSTLEISKEALSYLKNQKFPGNIRELKNLMERTALMATHSILETHDFIKHTEYQAVKPILNNESLLTIDEMEKKMILKAIKYCEGNMSRVSRSLGLSRGSLYRRLQKYNIPYEE